MKKNYFLLIFLSLASFVTAQDLFPYLNGNAYGFCDAKGKVQIAPQYDEVGFFDKNGFANVRKDTLWSLIDKSGVVYLPFESSKKYTIRTIPKCYDSDGRKYINKDNKVSQQLVVAISEYSNNFWLLDKQKKCNLGLYLSAFNKDQRMIPSYYDDYHAPNFVKDFLVTVHPDTTMSAFDTLGNRLIDKVQQIYILNSRFLSYPQGNSTALYDKKT
ncbi:MAG: hypothetical protein RLZZ292_2765, partial [Bacteroidota bacterium]